MTIVAVNSWKWAKWSACGSPRVRRRSLVGFGLVLVVGAATLHVANERFTAVPIGQPGAAEDVAHLIAAVAPDAPAIIRPDWSEGGALAAATAGGVWIMPPTLRDPITWTGDAGQPVSVSLRGAPGSARLASDGTVVYSLGSGGDLAVQALASGGIRAHAIVRAPDSTHTFQFDFGSPVVASLTDAGAVELRRQIGDSIESIGRLEPPWARDADGRPVPTRFAVSGGVVTQEVLASPDHRYPIVADPFWIPVLGVMARFGAHVLQRMAARKISQDLVKQVVLNGKRTRGNKPGTSVFTQGSGPGRIRVVVNDKTGNIITVTKG
jgi:uncharacterized protein DUF4258